MNRTELVRAVAERAGGDEAAARRHVDAVFDTVMDRVSAGERVIVTGFGTFDRLSRPARSARNPRTGLPVEVPAAQVPRFRSGQTFRTRVAASAPAAEVQAAEVQAAAEPAPVVSVAVEPPRPKKAKNGGKKAKKGPDAKKKNAKQAKAASAPAKKKQGKAKARAKAGKPGKAAKAGR
ncbi:MULTISPECIES: HU family DNA-binding protein [Actinomadura]|uniref:DNA-binding protein HU-beta n=1 Tax=Actinomadura madurae TaxID=1993 RepID=A0A1I4XXL3_9ACTN|nr:HU family DNA-binding protein [Actinomadura madurae]SFN30083.1 DNA-binding protein HU-beta [Actinomadura madurae]